MANGFYGTREAWETLEAPLLGVDSILEEFAARRELSLTKNHKAPERSFRWGAPISRLIQIYVSDEKAPHFNLWVCASEDRNGRRFWRRQTLLEEVGAGAIACGLHDSLDEAYRLASSWLTSDLEPVGRT